MLAAMPVAPSPPADLASALRATLSRIVPDNARLLLGVSGGSDSMALLAAAHEAFPERDRLLVAHVRHGLRTDDAQDAELVREVCANLHRPCRVLDASPDGPGRGRSETAARRRRMAALARAANDAGAGWVLLAHHIDDDLQTTLLHMARGHRGDRALAGIPTVRSLDARTRLLRPFLAGPSPPDRVALAGWREAAGLPFREDPTNRDTGVLRNRVRVWLDEQDTSLRRRLRRAQLSARSRVQTRLLAAARALEAGLRREGLGCCVPRELLMVGKGADPQQDLAERLRLLAGCLARPRRLDTRGTVLAALTRLIQAGSGRMSLPADPQPLHVSASRVALHLPDETLAPGPAAARVLNAVGAGSLYL